MRVHVVHAGHDLDRPLIDGIQAIIDNDRAEPEGEMIDAQETGECPDHDNREVSVPVEWLQLAVTRLAAAP